MKILKETLNDDMNKEKEANNRQNKETGGSLWRDLNTSIVFPCATAVARLTPLIFFNGYENGPKALFAYCIGGTLIDMAEAACRIYGKNELGPDTSLGADSEAIKKAQEVWDTNKEEHMSWAKPYSCFEKHVFYDVPKRIYDYIKRKRAS